jgi:hypothetical protein
MAVVSSIAIYPVKSMGRIQVDAARVTRRGLEHDRRWLVQRPDGTMLTARESPRLVLIETRVVDGGVELSAQGTPSILAREVGPSREALVWKTSCDAIDAGDEVADWLSHYLGEPARLVHQRTPREVNPTFARPGDELSFADGYPVNLASVTSLAELNRRIQLRDPAAAVPMTRFRPNVVIDGADAFAEDDWKTLTIGSVRFTAPKGCDRCVFTTIDPETAALSKEPLVTLSTFRRWDGNVWFGRQLIPDQEGEIHVGDRVEVGS